MCNLLENHDEKYAVPTLDELGLETDNLKATVWHGGETETLSRWKINRLKFVQLFL